MTGHFFDWGLRNGFLHFYPSEKRAEILGDGNAKSSNSSLRRVGKVVVKTLASEEEAYRADMRGRVLMVQSFCVSQNETLDALKRVLGEEGWTVEYKDLKGFIEEKKRLADAGDGEAVEDLVYALGVEDGNWEEKDDFAMGVLGLEDENLDDVVREALGK